MKCRLSVPCVTLRVSSVILRRASQTSDVRIGRRVKPKVQRSLFLSKKESTKTVTDVRNAGRDRNRAMPRQKEETERREGKAKRAEPRPFRTTRKKKREGRSLPEIGGKSETAYFFVAAALSDSALITFSQSSVAALKFS